jgi:hypothetical protein
MLGDQFQENEAAAHVPEMTSAGGNRRPTTYSTAQRITRARRPAAKSP